MPTISRGCCVGIESLDLGDSWRFLGLIPYKDVLSLMRSSVAVINPSLVEGWSTTVEEAKSLRVPLVLSDILVHREQAIRDAIFFDPHSAAAAAAALLEASMRFAAMPRGAERPIDPDWQERLRNVWFRVHRCGRDCHQPWRGV